MYNAIINCLVFLAVLTFENIVDWQIVMYCGTVSKYNIQKEKYFSLELNQSGKYIAMLYII